MMPSDERNTVDKLKDIGEVIVAGITLMVVGIIIVGTVWLFAVTPDLSERNVVEEQAGYVMPEGYSDYPDDIGFELPDCVSSHDC
jgi:hypothetical protein